MFVRTDHNGGFTAGLLLYAVAATCRRGPGWTGTGQLARAGRHRIPQGLYRFGVGWFDAYQLVKVPVVIKAGCLTTVNLEKNDHGLFPTGKTADLLQTPDGRIVGWAANAVAVR